MEIAADITLEEYLQRADKRTSQYKSFKSMYDNFKLNNKECLNLTINEIVGGYTKKLKVTK